MSSHFILGSEKRERNEGIHKLRKMTELNDPPMPSSTAANVAGSDNSGTNVRSSTNSNVSRISRQGPRGLQDTKFQQSLQSSGGKSSSSPEQPGSSSIASASSSLSKNNKTRRSGRENDKFRGSRNRSLQPHHQQQDELEDGNEGHDDDDHFTTQSDLPGAIRVGGQNASVSGRSLITSMEGGRHDIDHIEEGGRGDGSQYLPTALPAEVVEEREAIIATLADEYVNGVQNKRDENSESGTNSVNVTLSVKSLIVMVCVVIVVAVAVSVGVGVAVAGGRNNEMDGNGNDMMNNPGSGNLQDFPSASPSAMMNPPPSSSQMVCSCWYYTQDIYVTDRDDYKELRQDQRQYFAAVIKGRMNQYEPTNGNFVELGISTNKVFIESQTLFGNFNALQSGISLGYQLEYCGPASSGVNEELLMEFHSSYAEYMSEEFHRQGVVSSIQQEVGISSAYAMSFADRLDQSC